MYLLIKIFVLFIVILNQTTGLPCVLRKYEHGYVCVCNSTYCDSYENIKLPEKIGEVTIISTTKLGLRFDVSAGMFEASMSKTGKSLIIADRKKRINKLQNIIQKSKKNKKWFVPEAPENKPLDEFSATLKINPEKKFQKFFGFGGAITSAVSISLDKIEQSLRNYIYESYYGIDKGIGYNFIRTPIGGCDFDLSPWAYNELPINDKNLANFTKLDERELVKINHIRELKTISNNHNIKLLGAAWSPPPWMKTNNDWTGLGILKYEYYQTWANYHLKYLELIEKENISFWGISTGNEPLNGIVGRLIVPFISLGWLPNDQANWVANNLGPTLKNSKFKEMKILAGDDQRYIFPWWFEKMEKTNKKSLDYIDGYAVHWYSDLFSPVSLLDQTNQLYPDKFIINTEACIGDKPTETHGPVLGSWDRVLYYLHAIMQDLNHWVTGWIDWNILLDEYGGPNYVNNNVSSPIIVNTTSGEEAYKNPIFYAVGHFSKFVIPGSIRVDSSSSNDNIKIVAFLRPDGYTVAVIHSLILQSSQLFIVDKRRGSILVNVPASSIHTVVYK